MSFNLIVTCVSQKNVKKAHSILDPSIKPGSLESVFSQWSRMVNNSDLSTKKASKMYTGSLWNACLDAWGIVHGRMEVANLWILSAGFGLISSSDEIVPYDITFQEPRDGVPSLFSKVIIGEQKDARKHALQKWWRLLTQSVNRSPSSIESLIGDASKEDYFLIVTGKDYLDAVFDDLARGIKKAKEGNHIAVISNNVNDPTAKRLKTNWLYADSRFVNLPGSNSTMVNAIIAKHLLWRMFQEEGGLSWWSIDNFNSYLKNLSAGLKEVKIPKREPSSDDDVEEYIRNALVNSDTPFSKLHRLFRNAGRACEYTRFRAIYKRVKSDLKEKTSKKRPYLPVNYKRRVARMQFFLPDWDDRVDPFFDFEKDEVTPNRDPYEHDAYHYELYGSLNCDGILVSKSVLEDNFQKKERAQLLGIHKYLRLPKKVPVLGDCGAFNYISMEEPPYKTDEILTYYESLGFNYGVSIDHLIVPGILKQSRYLKNSGDTWIEISQKEFERLRESEDGTVAKSRNFARQRNLFSEKTVLVEEEFLSEKERDRRYELTLKNALDFLQGHRMKGCSFTAIAAVQGWDPQSYAEAVKECQNMGYSFIALGGLVKSTTAEILAVLETVGRIKRKGTRLHVFGVARLEAIEKFMRLGVTSVDSAGMLRQAWLSSNDNYHTLGGDNYTAIRVPPSETSSVAKELVKKGVFSEAVLRTLEWNCLTSLKEYDRGKITVDTVLDNIVAYDRSLGLDADFHEKYRRTLLERPWTKCPCPMCREIGIDVVIFRRNNRNRRRGFHNTWVFFTKFREITGESVAPTC